MDVRTALLPVLAAGVLTSCAAGLEQDDAVAGPAPASAEPSPTASAAASETSRATPAPRTVAVSYAGGEVAGTSGREEVPVGEQVVLRISSDVAEQVHVHGYDVQATVPAGGSVDIPLRTSIPGVFEVELHDSGKVLFSLRVA